ncbi:MAG: FHA domain-containing protein [Kiritimatiellae bacterium]|nr:FHA domain-containing protein [Kiritimatiellia bacterium]
MRKPAPALELSKDGRVLFRADAAGFPGTLTIGRSRECDWCLAGADPSASGRHAEVTRRRGSFYVRDLGSRNGVLADGVRVASCRLRPGRPVRIGGCELAVVAGAAAADSPAFHRIEQTGGPEAGRAFDLKPGPGLAVGSDPACDVVCPGPFVSRRHLLFRLDERGDPVVECTGARNGATVNGLPLLKTQQLADGDSIVAADREFRFLDKNVPHVRAGLGRKALVAGATLLLALAARQIWLAARPDAGRLLDRARAAAAAESFSEAFALADEAAAARRAPVYESARRALLADLSRWTNAIVRWRGPGDCARSMLRARRWKAAPDYRSGASDWGWNTTTSPAMQAEERRAFDLLDAFNGPGAGRNLLRDEAVAGAAADPVLRDRAAAAFEAAADRLAAATAAVWRAAAPPPPPDWYLRPLVESAAAVEDALRAAAAANAALDARFGALRLPDCLAAPPDGAARLARDLAALASQDAQARERAEEDRRTGRYPVLRRSRLLADRIEAAGPVVGRLVAAEAVFASNLAAVARCDGAAFAPALPLPDEDDARAVHPALAGYAASLASLQADLDGFRVEWDSAAGQLARWDLDPARPAIPGDMAFLFSLEKLPAAPPRGAPLPPAGAAAPADPYDFAVGARDFRDFLDPSIKTRFETAATAYVRGSKLESSWSGPVPPELARLGVSFAMPLVRRTANRLRVLRAAAAALDGTPARDPRGLHALVRTVPDAPGRPNLAAGALRLHGLVSAAADKWRQGPLSAAAAPAGRDAALAEAVRALLFPPAKAAERAAAAARIAEKLAADREEAP